MREVGWDREAGEGGGGGGGGRAGGGGGGGGRRPLTHHAGGKAGLTDQGRLLVTKDAGDGNLRAPPAGVVPVQLARRPG